MDNYNYTIIYPNDLLLEVPMSADFNLTDNKKRYSLLLSYSKTEGLYLKNIVVREHYRDRGFAKCIIYTLWRCAKCLRIDYIIVNIISPIIESIIKRYYVWEEISIDNHNGLCLKIKDILDGDYSESILPIFLDVYWNITNYK